ncbi:ferredoxin domain-containing protein [Sporomusa aerivorans]|uniref:ferredoxin domain-containing protein n=1 Tax=Sporomusa aerivorans TaxID=204936 RepID=UPI003529F5AE
MIIQGKELEQRAVEQVAELMCAAARTAPKGRGIDNLVVLVVKGRAKDQLVEEMKRIAKESGAQFFDRDANCLEKTQLAVLLGQKVKPMGVNPCGYCGFNNCKENTEKSGLCAISIGDLGIAVSSAAAVAAEHHIDNRIMFSIGRAALNLAIFDDDVKIAYGIPLSVSGKSPFFDRS